MRAKPAISMVRMALGAAWLGMSAPSALAAGANSPPLQLAPNPNVGWVSYGTDFIAPI